MAIIKIKFQSIVYLVIYHAQPVMIIQKINAKVVIIIFTYWEHHASQYVQMVHGKIIMEIFARIVLKIV